MANPKFDRSSRGAFVMVKLPERGCSWAECDTKDRVLEAVGRYPSKGHTLRPRLTLTLSRVGATEARGIGGNSDP